MSLRFKICLTAWAAIVAAAAMTGEVSAQEASPLPEPAVDAQALPKPAAQEETQPDLTAPDAAVDEEATPAATFNEPLPQPIAVPQPITPAYVEDHVSDTDWQMVIRPALRVRETAPAPVAAYAAPTSDNCDNCDNCGPANATDYARVYASIPFDRAQYNANPNYRHDSTMEILTGNARHQTIVRHSTTRQRRPVAAAVPVRTGYGNPYNYGYLRPSLRLNYYRNFPSLNPYINMWNLSGAY